MKTIFKTMDEIQEFVTVDISANFKTIKPYLVEANKWLQKGLDKVTLNALLDYYNDEDAEADEAFDNLLEYARRVVANFAYAISAKRLGIFVGENGLMEYGNTTLKPLETDKLEAYAKEFFSSGYNALEELILFIKDNEEDYADAFAYLFVNTFFVRTAEEFNEVIKTDILNRDFFDMKPSFYLIEKDIEGIITKEIADELKALLDADDVEEDDQALLDVIKPAECLLAYGEKFKSEKHTLRGMQLMEQLRITYAEQNNTDIDSWDNEDQHIYVFK